MILLVLPKEKASLIDTDNIKGIENYTPENTVRYNLDKTEHIKTVLGLDDLSEYVMDSSDVVYNNPNTIS